MSISLNALLFQDIKIRFLLLQKVADGYRVASHQKKVDNINDLTSCECPVFLASDVCLLLDSPTSSNSVSTRFLHKTKALGMHTSISFNGVSVKGINNSRLLNFVSIRAVFMALFTGSDAYLQKIVGRQLWNTWITYSEVEIPCTLQFTSTDHILTQEPDVDLCDTVLLDKLYDCFDSCPQEVTYRSHLQSLMNSFRSLCVRLGAEDFSHVILACEQLIQSLIAYESASVVPVDSMMLDVTSAWVGNQFNSMNSAIQETVNKFKSDNLADIHQLPSAKSTCCLFPKSMLILFENWLHTREDNSLEVASKRAKMEKDDIYPIIQLLLEFCNKTLISGVAHVVYTQLLNDPT